MFTAPSGAVQRKIWRVAAAEGVAARQIDERGIAEGDAVRCDERHAVVERAEVHTLLPYEPADPKPRFTAEVVADLQRRVPVADIYVAVGREATLMLASGKLPPRWRGVEDHAASVIREPHGLVALPREAVVVPLHLPGFIPQEHKARQAALWGNEEWYLSQRLTMRRVRALLDGTLPEAPPQEFHLFAGERDIPALREAARAAGGVSIDLETPRDGGSIYVGAFAVGSEAWVFDSAGTVAAARALFAEDITVDGQNHCTFDLPILAEHGVPFPRGPIRDCRWLHSKTNPRMPHDLCSIGSHTLPWAPPNHKPLSDAPPMSAGQRQYCAVDAWLAFWIARQLEKEFV